MTSRPEIRNPCSGPRSVFRKIWDQHVILERDDGPSLLYIDRHMIHEGSFHAFGNLRRDGMTVRRPGQVFGAADHYAPTIGRTASDASNPDIANMLRLFDENMAWSGVHAFGLKDPRQGIVHVIGPELGITLPGATITCSDSHTSTQGALGALAFGIGQSESQHVLATQTIWQTRPRQMRVTVEGRLPRGVEAKDLILAIIGQIGAGGGTGSAIEFAGPAIRALSVEERLTVCNMSIEAAARCGIISPDETVFDYVRGRSFAPESRHWEAALAKWRALASDTDAEYDREVSLDATQLAPMITWGTSPEDVIRVDGHAPDPASFDTVQKRESTAAALQYMGLEPGQKIEGLPVDQVFLGSCTNGRIEDLRRAASWLRGRRARVPAMVVPGSTAVRRQAEAEGLDRIFTEAGFEWRQSGCSMCSAMNGDTVAAGKRCISTSNRNFVGRQGRGARTHLASATMAVAAAVTGRITDIRHVIGGAA